MPGRDIESRDNHRHDEEHRRRRNTTQGRSPEHLLDRHHRDGSSRTVLDEASIRQRRHERDLIIPERPRREERRRSPGRVRESDWDDLDWNQPRRTRESLQDYSRRHPSLRGDIERRLEASGLSSHMRFVDQCLQAYTPMTRAEREANAENFLERRSLQSHRGEASRHIRDMNSTERRQLRDQFSGGRSREIREHLSRVGETGSAEQHHRGPPPRSHHRGEVPSDTWRILTSAERRIFVQVMAPLTWEDLSIAQRREYIERFHERERRRPVTTVDLRTRRNDPAYPSMNDHAPPHEHRRGSTDSQMPPPPYQATATLPPTYESATGSSSQRARNPPQESRDNEHRRRDRARSTARDLNNLITHPFSALGLSRNGSSRGHDKRRQ